MNSKRLIAGLLLPLAQHGQLDRIGGQVRQIAVGALAVPTETEEVGVLLAATAGVAESDPFVASGAVQGALEVLLALPGPLAGSTPVQLTTPSASATSSRSSTVGVE